MLINWMLCNDETVLLEQPLSFLCLCNNCNSLLRYDDHITPFLFNHHCTTNIIFNFIFLYHISSLSCYLGSYLPTSLPRYSLIYQHHSCTLLYCLYSILYTTHYSIYLTKYRKRKRKRKEEQCKQKELISIRYN